MNEPTRWTQHIEPLSKLALAAAGLLYVVGLIVTALHLMQFGVFSLSLVRPHYVLAGTWPVLPLAFLAALAAWTLTAWDDDRPSSPPLSASSAARWWHRLVRVNALVSPVVAWVAIVFMVASYVATRGSAIPWTLRQIVLGGLAFLAFFAGLALLSAATWSGARVPRETAGRARHWQGAVRTVAFASLLVFCLLGYLRFFVDHVYPAIPSRIGGGKPIPVTIVLKAPETVSTIGLPSRTGEARALRCELIVDSDKTYVLRAVDPPRTVFELSKDLVAAVLLDDPR
jgi:hypothetical protein